MAMTKITNLIDTDNKSEYITKMWTAVYPVLREKYVLTSKLGKVNIADAKKYEGKTRVYTTYYVSKRLYKQSVL